METRTAGHYAPFLLGCPLLILFAPSTCSVPFILWQRLSLYMSPLPAIHPIWSFKASQQENHSREFQNFPARKSMSLSGVPKFSCNTIHVTVEFHKLTDWQMDRRRKKGACTQTHVKIVQKCTFDIFRFLYTPSNLNPKLFLVLLKLHLKTTFVKYCC